MRKLLLLSLLALVLLALSSAQSAHAQAAPVCTNSTDNVYCTLNYTNPALQACVQARCATTEPSRFGAAPASTYTSPWCDSNVPESEASASCATLMRAYNAYFACVVRAVAADERNATGTYGAALLRASYLTYLRTPGFPYHLAPPSVLAHDFYEGEVVPRVLNAVQRTCPSNYVACCALEPQRGPNDLPAKGYYHILCGVGCRTGLFLMAFTIISLCMFVACGCCWPTPSLRTTARKYKAAQAAAKTRRAALSDADAPPTALQRQPQPLQPPSQQPQLIVVQQA